MQIHTVPPGVSTASHPPSFDQHGRPSPSSSEVIPDLSSDQVRRRLAVNRRVHVRAVLILDQRFPDSGVREGWNSWQRSLPNGGLQRDQKS